MGHEESLHEDSLVGLAVLFLGDLPQHVHVCPVAETEVLTGIEGVMDGDVITGFGQLLPGVGDGIFIEGPDLEVIIRGEADGDEGTEVGDGDAFGRRGLGVDRRDGFRLRLGFGHEDVLVTLDLDGFSHFLGRFVLHRRNILLVLGLE